MRVFLIGLATLSLAACGGGASQQNSAGAANNAALASNAMDNAANAIDHVAAIENLSETQQQAVFLRAIRDADISCRDVTKVERLEPEGGVPTWRAQCDQGDAHLIMVQPDGNAQVMSRPTR
ncbi:hypothetical protein M2337_000952 [Sphingobium sp. B2D3A]|uniref:hypothetical protein n=1 Tax=unclassified Sphingobium TaxID=2611147 RepID=UPI0022250396|nr:MULTISPECIES: hypothetical protein [unclassified Sphingobium]MCW2336719.1 hypothetical protein [Sphingobium sp. B2D3A]MCW2386473.1 hypothetical protein [Sphingobium sp. B2D3D]MCW2410783.1 hypothetical protein [Sphingobium sp. B8D3D]MCW2416927.1 hypothetical protein [Sphingobium sp. B8D3A]